jgi:PKD repeat protein
VTHTYDVKGTYQVTLLITDSSGGTGAWSDAVQVLNRLPTARFTFSPFWVYAGNDATFDASDSYDEDGEIVQYLWSFGDGSTGEGMVVKHAFPFSTEGGPWIATVTLTVIDEDGGSTTTSKQINVRGCATCG